jgi:hypothetical protein
MSLFHIDALYIDTLYNYPSAPAQEACTGGNTWSGRNVGVGDTTTLNSMGSFAVRIRVPTASVVLTSVLLATCLSDATPLAAQGLKLAVGDVGIGVGDVPRLDGLRLNYRDYDLELVRGINATIWMPYDGADGVVQGLALGVPLTGAAEISGIALGLGVGVERTFTGVGLAPIGFGAGEGIRGVTLAGVGMGTSGDIKGVAIGGIGLGAGGDVRGIALGGVGVGASGDLSGIAIGGIGLGAGGDLTGLAIGGVGLGASGNLTGVAIGGVGLGASGDVTGLGIGGIGVGASGDVRGILLGGIGVGAGRNVTGITIGGIGVGAGGEIKGLAIGGVGVGAPRITGVAIGGIGAGGEDVRGLIIAPAFFRIEDGGSFRGVSVSAYNDIRGRQNGLTIGLLNIADELHGLQVGVINIARNKESFSVLPLLNYHR